MAGGGQWSVAGGGQWSVAGGGQWPVEVSDPVSATSCRNARLQAPASGIGPWVAAGELAVFADGDMPASGGVGEWRQAGQRGVGEWRQAGQRGVGESTSAVRRAQLLYCVTRRRAAPAALAEAQRGGSCADALQHTATCCSRWTMKSNCFNDDLTCWLRNC